MSEASPLGSSVALQLRSLSINTQSAGSYGTLATTVQLKGFNLDVIPAATLGSSGDQPPPALGIVAVWPKHKSAVDDRPYKLLHAAMSQQASNDL